MLDGCKDRVFKESNVTQYMGHTPSLVWANARCILPAARPGFAANADRGRLALESRLGDAAMFGPHWAPPGCGHSSRHRVASRLNLNHDLALRRNLIARSLNARSVAARSDRRVGPQAGLGPQKASAKDAGFVQVINVRVNIMISCRFRTSLFQTILIWNPLIRGTSRHASSRSDPAGLRRDLLVPATLHRCPYRL
jgi:hypothetical protein